MLYVILESGFDIKIPLELMIVWSFTELRERWENQQHALTALNRVPGTLLAVLRSCSMSTAIIAHTDHLAI